MAQTVTPGELEFIYVYAFAGKAYKIFAATKGSLTINSTLAEWEAAELPTTNGYLPITGTIGSGTYNATTGKFTAPTIAGQFKGSGAGFTYDAVVIKVAGRTKPHSVDILDVPVVLAASQAKLYEQTFLAKL